MALTIGSLSGTSGVVRSVSSFYTKQPLLAVVTTVALAILGIIGFIYLRFNSPSKEEQIQDLIVRDQLQQAYSLTNQLTEISRRNDLLDRISDVAINLRELMLAEKAAVGIMDREKKGIALSRLFDFHLIQGDVEKASEIADLAHLDKDLKNSLYEKIFSNYLDPRKRDLDSALTFLGSHFSRVDNHDDLCIKLFEACLEVKNGAIAKDAVLRIGDLEKRQRYINFYRYQDWKQPP
jgi:hypothetical protein